MRGLLVVFNLFWTCSLSAAQNQAVIIYPPVSANVSAGQSAVFTCTAVADVIEWTADNQPVSDHDVYAKGFHPSSTQQLNGTIGLRRSNLSVAGQKENDNVSITCVAFNKGDILKVDTSDPVLLRVQGFLESVSNLTVTPINSTTVLISWSPPFTLKGVPILGYNVSITNNASEKYKTMFVKNNTLHYYYDYYDGMDYYNEYYVTVAPINDVGTGPNVTSDPFTFPLPRSVTPTVGSSQTTSGDVTSHGNSPFPSAVIIVVTSSGLQSSQMLLFGTIATLIMVTLLVFVLVVMVVVCVVVKRNRRRNNSTSDCNSRQACGKSLVVKNDHPVEEAVPTAHICGEPTQHQEAERPVPSNHEPIITITPQREHNQAQLDNPTVHERVERPSSLTDESHEIQNIPVNHQRRYSLQIGNQRDLYDKPVAGGRSRRSSLTTVMQQMMNLQGYRQMQSSDDEDESKQSSQRHEVAIQVDIPANQSLTASRSPPVMQPLLLCDQQHGVELPREACSPVERTLKRRISVSLFEPREGSCDSAMKEEQKSLLEEHR